MPPNSTPLIVVQTVVGTLCSIAVIGVCSLAATLFFKAYVDPTILTAFIGITTGAIGAVAGLLANTRQPQAQTNGNGGSAVTATVTSSTSTTPAVNIEQTEPQP